MTPDGLDHSHDPDVVANPIAQAKELRALAEASRIEAEEMRSIAREEAQHSAAVRDRARNLRQFLAFVRARREQRAHALEHGQPPLPGEPSRDGSRPTAH